MSAFADAIIDDTIWHQFTTIRKLLRVPLCGLLVYPAALSLATLILTSAILLAGRKVA